MTVDAAIARLRAYAAFKGWRKSRFAKEAGLSDTVLRDFDKEDWSPTADTLRKLESIVPDDWQPTDAAAIADHAAEALNEAILAACGPSNLAETCGVTIDEIAKWIQERQVAAEHVLSVEHATGISRHWLRPDLYPDNGKAA